MKPHPTHLLHYGRELTRKPIRALLALFTMATRRRPKMNDPGFENITFKSGDGTRLAGWIYRTPGRENTSGTVILAHGFTEHSGSQAAAARELSARHGLVALAFDHRLPGWSDDHVPTFGTQEAFDIQAAMNYADHSGLPKPYLLHGISLGALAAQRAGITDPRVAGLFLLACPAWPWDAIGVAVSGRTKHQLTLAGLLVNLYYGWDVLREESFERALAGGSA